MVEVPCKPEFSGPVLQLEVRDWPQIQLVLGELDRLIKNARKNGIDDLVMLDGKDVSGMEPNVTALRAIFPHQQECFK